MFWLFLTLTLVVFVVYLLRSKINLDVEAPGILEEIEQTAEGKMMVSVAKRQAERNGVGVVIYNNNVYTIRGSNAPKPNTFAYYKAVEKSMEEKFRKD
jgi:hypothetical protein